MTAEPDSASRGPQVSQKEGRTLAPADIYPALTWSSRNLFNPNFQFTSESHEKRKGMTGEPASAGRVPQFSHKEGRALAPAGICPALTWSYRRMTGRSFVNLTLRACVVIFIAVAALQAQEPALPSASAPSLGAPIAIVPVDADSSVTGALQVTGGKAIIATTGTITSGAKPTDVILPHRGTLRVCASTTVKLSTDSGAPAGETPGLMMALDQGAIETSFAIGRDSDVLLTPDFRILIGGPGASDVKIRLGQHGDTCIDNPGINAPYVVVSSVFDGGAYRVQPGQRVMFQHGSLQEVVDQEKEPCGCPPEARPGTNDFPLAQSAGLAPLSNPQSSPAPAPATNPGSATPPQLNEPLVYQAPAAETVPAPAATQTATPSTAAAAPTPAQSASATPQAPKRSFFHRVGSFFRRIFGAE